MTALRTILFDFGNVLIDIDVPGATQRLESHLHEDIAFTESVKLVSPLIRAYETGAIQTAQFIHGILKHAKPGVNAIEIISAWNSMLIGIPRYRLGMLEMLKENFTLLLLSNTNALHIDWVHTHLREDHGIENFEERYFHGVYYSHEIGYRKPEEEAFQFVVRDAIITPENTLFIDDMEENIDTAKRLGFKTRFFRPEEEIAVVLKRMGLY